MSSCKLDHKNSCITIILTHSRRNIDSSENAGKISDIFFLRGEVSRPANTFNFSFFLFFACKHKSSKSLQALFEKRANSGHDTKLRPAPRRGAPPVPGPSHHSRIPTTARRSDRRAEVEGPQNRPRLRQSEARHRTEQFISELSPNYNSNSNSNSRTKSKL